MGKYLKKFQNHSAYQSAKSGLILPNVSLCITEDDVHYNPIVPDNRLIITYSVEDDSQATMLYNGNRGNMNFFKVEVDGTEVSISSIDAANGMYQLSSGEHTVAYTLIDPTEIQNEIFSMCKQLVTVSIPNTVEYIGNYAFCYCPLDGSSRAAIAAINPTALECKLA